MPTFDFRKWAKAHFWSNFGHFFERNFELVVTFGQKKWAFARFYFESGHAGTVAITGFEGFLPTFPLFFFI